MAPNPSDPPVKTRSVRSAAPAIRRSVGTTLAEMARKAGFLDPAAIEHWGEIVGPDLEKLCRPVRIRKYKNAETLVVSVSSGAAAMKVQYAEKEILARAATHLGRQGLTKLSIEQTGTAARAPRWKSGNIKAPKRAAPPPEPPAETLDEALARFERSFKPRSR